MDAPVKKHDQNDRNREGVSIVPKESRSSAMRVIGRTHGPWQTRGTPMDPESREEQHICK